jgi:hypothetical protein
MGNRSSAYKISVSKTEGKSIFGVPDIDGMIMHLREMIWGYDLDSVG